MTKEEKKEYYKNYYEAHKEEKKEYYKNYYEAHKEEMNENHKNYCESHKEEMKEYYKNYHETHKEKQNKKAATTYYSKKNEFHGLNVLQYIHRYYRGCNMSRYFSSFENYISFSLNHDVALRQKLIIHMRLGKINEQDALDIAGVPLTEEDLDYIREYALKYRPRD